MTDLLNIFDNADAVNPFAGDLRNVFGDPKTINPFGGIDLRNVFNGADIAARAGAGRDPLDGVQQRIETDTMPPPKLTLGGVVLPGYGFSWAFTSGVDPYVTSIMVTRNESERLGLLRGLIQDETGARPGIHTVTNERGSGSQAAGPITLEFEASKMRGPGVFERVAFSVAGIYLLEPDNAKSPFEVSWAVADRRWTWARQTWSRRYNVTRKMNESAVAPDAKAEAAQFELIAKQRYLRWSLRRGKPWTAREIVLDLLMALVVNDIEDRTKTKGAFISENIGGPEIPMPELLAAALAAAEYEIFIDRRGRVVLYDAIETHADHQRLAPIVSALVAGSGWAMPEDLRQMRPQRVDVLFVKEQELRFAAVEEGGSTIDRDDPRLGMRNVLPLPANVTRLTPTSITALGDLITVTIPTVFTRGTWVTIDDALALWNADADGKPALTLDKIRKQWFGNLLEVNYGLDSLQVPNPIWAARIAAIRQHYRQTYRISPRWIDAMADWAPVRSGIVDYTTGYRQRSEAQGDHCMVWTTRAKGVNAIGRRAGDQKAAINISADTSETGVPARLDVIDKELGIVRLNYFPDVFGSVLQIVPSKVDNIPAFSMGAAAAGNVYWDGASLTSVHNLSVIITAVMADDPAGDPDSSSNARQVKAGFHTIQIQPSDVGVSGDTLGPPVRILSTRERASFRWAADFNSNQAVDLVVKHELVNGEMIQAIAEAEARREYHMWHDRLSGTFTVAGYHKTYEPLAGVSNVAVVVAGNGSMTTTFDTTKHFMRDVVNMVPAELRAKLLAQIQ